MIIDKDTGLEVRTYGPLVKDPDLSVLIDSLDERGLIRCVAEWTDEEAERCRLAAFMPNTAMHAYDDEITFGRRFNFPKREWAQGGIVVAVELPFSAYDPSPDVKLVLPLAEWAGVGSRRAPRWCFTATGNVLPWSMLVATARERLAEQAADELALATQSRIRKARKAARAEARP